MSKLGNQVEEFQDSYNRIRNKFSTLNESPVKLEAIQALKEIQANLTTINFLDVISVMDPSNPLKSDIEQFEMALADIRGGIEEFIVANQFDIEEEEIIDNGPENNIEDESKKISVSGETKVKTEIEPEPDKDPELKKVKSMK